MTTNYCPNCGSAADRLDQQFCMNCGKALDQKVEPISEVENKSQQRVAHPSEKISWLGGNISSLIIPCISIIVLLYTMGNQPTYRSNGQYLSYPQEAISRWLGSTKDELIESMGKPTIDSLGLLIYERRCINPISGKLLGDNALFYTKGDSITIASYAELYIDSQDLFKFMDHYRVSFEKQGFTDLGYTDNLKMRQMKRFGLEVDIFYVKVESMDDQFTIVMNFFKSPISNPL